MKDRLIAGIAVFFVAYFIAATAIFAFRHPWMTDTERLIYLPKALTFQTVKYQDARPHE